MLRGNKGEWSEVYALFKLLGDGKLYPGDKNLNKITNLFFPIIKIIKNELGINCEYTIDGDLVIISNIYDEFRISVDDFASNAVKLLQLIKSQEGTFGDSDIENFMHSFNSRKLKAKSSSKTDIRIVIHDLRIGQTADLGFSIKSELGGNSTLLNAGETTNFIYKITGYNFSNAEIDLINSISTGSKIKDRLNAILRQGTKINFFKTNKEVFGNNLILIDSLLPDILAEIVYNFYTTNNSKIIDLTSHIHNLNPLKYDIKFSHNFYEYKIKKFLIDIALGMMPSKIWQGIYDTTGGHLIIKRNGDIICYHIYNRNQFEDYLFNNTKLDTASSTRHKFGILYKEGDDYFIKLNLQIRF
ncbi:HpaII family restriction endonuclease [Flavobacterium sp. MK4S-17]|uniref:HpaII family restriction endonuclease n=1 Tax=Flavobacterium sp. MK4S-17 TaxID=2543737 RepID=UPI00135C59C0|nr:HpaII family restriction endonuclease [Flavobacterium sp. MK4S-17]